MVLGGLVSPFVRGFIVSCCWGRLYLALFCFSTLYCTGRQLACLCSTTINSINESLKYKGKTIRYEPLRFPLSVASRRKDPTQKVPTPALPTAQAIP